MEAPTCWVAFSIAEAAPASCWPAPTSARFDSGTNVNPRPRPSSSWPGKGRAQKLVSRPTNDSVNSPLAASSPPSRSEEHTSELQSRQYLVCRLLLEKKKTGPKSRGVRPPVRRAADGRRPDGQEPDCRRPPHRPGLREIGRAHV